MPLASARQHPENQRKTRPAIRRGARWRVGLDIELSSTPNPGVYRRIQLSAANQGTGFGAWYKKVYTPNANQERFFSTHRASIRNQNPRNTCKHQRNPSAFSIKPRVYKPQKMGGSWDSNGGCFLFSLFSEVKSQKTGFLWRARLIRWFSFLIRAREGHVLCYTAPYTAVYENGGLVRG